MAAKKSFYTAEEIRVDYDLTGDWLELNRANVETDWGEVIVSGRVRLFDGGEPGSDPTFDLEVEGPALDLAGLLPDQPVAGTVGVTARVTGTSSRPRVQGSGELREAFLFDEWVESARAEFSYTSRGIDVTDVRQVKGLEFDYVVILDPTEQNYPTSLIARHLLHIAATRAAYQLWLLCAGRPSSLIPSDLVETAMEAAI